MNQEEPTTLKEHLARELKTWSEKPNGYLGLDYGKEEKQFSEECPPLLCMVGKKLIERECIVIITMEPRLDKGDVREGEGGDTFTKQQEFLKIRSRDNHALSLNEVNSDRYFDWNLCYFETFENILTNLERSEDYWKRVSLFLKGWFPHLQDIDDYSALSRHCIEIPMIPMHAERHPGNQFTGKKHAKHGLEPV